MINPFIALVRAPSPRPGSQSSAVSCWLTVDSCLLTARYVLHERLTPVARSRRAGRLKLAVVQDRVGRAPGRGAVLGSSRGTEIGGNAGDCKGGTSVIIPRGLAPGRAVVQAVRSRARDERQGRRGHVLGAGRRNDLVGDDAQRSSGRG